MMREWVANQTSGAYYIDFDALAFAPNLPVRCPEGRLLEYCRQACPGSGTGSLRLD